MKDEEVTILPPHHNIFEEEIEDGIMIPLEVKIINRKFYKTEEEKIIEKIKNM